MQTERKIHTGLVGGMLVIAALILFIAHTKPSVGRLATAETQVAALEAELKTITSQDNEASSTLSEVEERRLASKIPQSLEQDIIINDINKIAKESEVTFNALTFSLAKNSTLPTIVISAGFQGQYENLTRFLRDLELNPRKIIIRDASVSRSAEASTIPGASASPIVSLNLTMESYYRDASN